MRTLRRLPAALLTLALTASSAGAAQQRHVVDPSTLAGTVADHARGQEAQRDEIRQALSRPEVQSLASNFGVDANTLSSSVNILDADTLNRAAPLAHDVNQAVTGGGFFGTTTIIILLLLLILIIVVAA